MFKIGINRFHHKLIFQKDDNRIENSVDPK